MRASMIHKNVSRPGTASARATPICKAAAQPNYVKQFAAAAASGLLTTMMVVAPAFASVEFTNPPSSATQESPLKLSFAVKGMEIRPAADGLVPNTGHFHILIDDPVSPEGSAIVFNDSHKHYGKGQTTAEVELAPGKHTLTLQFANALHESYGPGYASTITVMVK